MYKLNELLKMSTHRRAFNNLICHITRNMSFASLLRTKKSFFSGKEMSIHGLLAFPFLICYG